MKTCMYLRKSRSDEELEKTGQYNTLNRHKDTLLKLANTMNLSIVKIYEEIVSGESLNQRPEMLNLLEDVSSNMYDSVLVMDMDRLGRGNMQEQGLILDTFKNSHTKIITPRKIYDLNDEFDEEYSEFEAFMARKELKIITRRMQRGRIKSIEEGNYIGTYAPFGYKIDGYGRNRKLIIDPVNSEAIKLIFNMYSNGLGGTKIADKLNKMGYKASNDKPFYSHSIINIIKNPVYTGKVTWNKKSYKKGDLNKRRTVKLNPKNEWIIQDGKHEPIISEELFNECEEILKSRSHPPCKKGLTNPFAGIVFCKNCGASMHYRPYKKSEPYLMCPKCNKYVSSKFRLIENEIINLLEETKNNYSVDEDETHIYEKNKVNQKIKENLLMELSKFEKQRSSLHDLLEQGVYDIETFLSRQEIITSKINDINKDIAELSEVIQVPKSEIIKNISTVLDVYKHSQNNELKNKMLKTIISKIVYERDKGTKPDEFKLYVTLKI